MRLNTLNWFEIPATDIYRAAAFYSTILDSPMDVFESRGLYMSVLPSDPERGMGGAVVAGPDYVPTKEGIVIYLNCNPDLRPVLDRVEAAGGTIISPITDLGGRGIMAFILDTEGNKIGLHSNGGDR